MVLKTDNLFHKIQVCVFLFFSIIICSLHLAFFATQKRRLSFEDKRLCFSLIITIQDFFPKKCKVLYISKYFFFLS